MILFIININYVFIFLLTAFYFILKDMYYSCDSDNPLLDINYQPTTKKKVNRNPQDRDKINAKERECRNLLAKRFQTLRKFCSYLNNYRRKPSKCSILLAAKKECDLLTYYNKKILENKIYWLKKNEILKSRINKLKIDGYTG